jgi:cysteine desulfurase/selenocysteine lyase
MVAMGWGLNNLKTGDVILTTISEHNSSVLPWQLVSKKTGAVLDYIYLNEIGELDLVAFKKQVLSFNGRVKVLVISHASNVLGTIFDIKAICRFASEHGIVTVVDGAQSIPHLKVNVTSLGCDFYGFSAHKDSDHLVGFVNTATSRLKKIFVVMGEPRASIFLAQRIRDELKKDAVTPSVDDEFEI